MAYVSGGIGLESRDQLSSIAGDFNSKLGFAVNSGAYLSGAQVTIVDGKGETILDAISDGPRSMAKLPTGNYQVIASVAGKIEKRRVAIGTSPFKTVDLRWAPQ